MNNLTAAVFKDHAHSQKILSIKRAEIAEELMREFRDAIEVEGHSDFAL